MLDEQVWHWEWRQWKQYRFKGSCLLTINILRSDKFPFTPKWTTFEEVSFLISWGLTGSPGPDYYTIHQTAVLTCVFWAPIPCSPLYFLTDIPRIFSGCVLWTGNVYWIVTKSLIIVTVYSKILFRSYKIENRFHQRLLLNLWFLLFL